MHIKAKGSGSLSRRFRDFAKFGVLRPALELGQRLGVSIVPRHYYSEIPDLRLLANEEAWRRRSLLRGIRGSSIFEQADEARRLFAASDREGESEETDLYERACRAEGAMGFSPIDAVCLYRFLCNTAPKRVIQVGSGVSTAVALEWKRVHNADCEILCIEPYPSTFLERESSAGRIQLREEKAQATPEDVFGSLHKGDLLFIDSTHTTTPGSEVNRLVLEVLPMLRAGVWVHFHDIWFPYHFRPDILSHDLFFWRETLLLQAFLSGNWDYRLATSLSMLHHDDPVTLQALIPWYEPLPHDGGLMKPNADDGAESSGHWPVSCYLQRMSVAAHED